MMVGEIRDSETLDIAVKAALTGHLVLSTLHTNDAPSTITRMVDMGVDPFMVASSSLLGRRAAPRPQALRSTARRPSTSPKERLIEVGLTNEEAKTAKIFQASGCASARGYAGASRSSRRCRITEASSESSSPAATRSSCAKPAIKEGMMTLRDAGLANALRGITSIEEVLARRAPPTKQKAKRLEATDEERRR